MPTQHAAAGWSIQSLQPLGSHVSSCREPLAAR